MNDFRVTFNKPAEKAYFEGENANGVQVKVEDGSIQFRASENSKGSDIAPISPRGRGGLEALFDGDAASQYFEILTKSATQARPFFLLHRSGKGGWFGFRHYNQDGAPPKFEPHIRLWWKPSDSPSRSEPVVTEDASEYVTRIRAARKLVEEHRESRKIGRPPRDVAEAMALLEGFERLAAEVAPSTPSSMNMATVVAAFDVMTKFMREVTGRAEAAAAAAASFPVAVEPPAAAEEPKRRGGRPKGSKNKPKEGAAVSTEAASDQEAIGTALVATEQPRRRGGRPKKVAEAPRKMGRPKGSKNKPKAVAEAQPTERRRGGRPKGSKNKPKVATESGASTERRGPGRPKATVVKKAIFIRPPVRARRGTDATVQPKPSDEGAAEARDQLGMAPVPASLGARGRKRVLSPA